MESNEFNNFGVSIHLRLVLYHLVLWASLVAHMVKTPSAMRETWVQSLGWEDSLEKRMASHSSILAWRILMDRGAEQATVHGVTKSQTRLSN